MYEEQRLGTRKKPNRVCSGDEDEGSKWRRGGWRWVVGKKMESGMYGIVFIDEKRSCCYR